MCVKLRPDWEKAHFRRGMALEDKGDDDDALAAFEAARATATGAHNPEIAKKIKYLMKSKARPSSIVVPKTLIRGGVAPPPPSKPSPGDRGGPAGDPAWLETAKSPGQPVAAESRRREPRRRMARGAPRARSPKRPAGESEWFFEEREVVKFLDHGVFGVMLDVLTHTVVSIIAAERSDDARGGGGGERGRRSRRRLRGACYTTSSTRASGAGTRGSRTRRCSRRSSRCSGWRGAL